MKTKFLALLSVAVLFAACDKENAPSEGPSAQAEKFDISARNEFAWKKADKVSIFDGKSNNMFRSQGAGEVATLSGEAIKAKVLYGLVPYDKNASLTDGTINASIPAEQNISAGTLPFISVAKTEDPTTMQFETIAAYLKINVADDVEGLNGLKVSSTAGETLAGNISISFDGGVKVNATSTTSQVSASAFEGSFKAGESYYIAVLPGTYAEGFTVFYTIGGETFETTLKGSQSLKAGSTTELCGIRRPLSPNEKLFVGSWQVTKWGSRAYDDPTGQHCWISEDKGFALPETTLDDVITFGADGSVKIDLGKDGKAWNAAVEDAVSVELTGDETWSLVENGEALTLKLSGNAFPLFLTNWDGLTTDYNVFRISATEIVLEYDNPANEGYAQVYLQPKGMKSSKHTFTKGDFGLNSAENEEMESHEGPATTKEGFKWYLDVEAGAELFIWKTWGALQVGAGWSANADLHVKSIKLHTTDIPGNIKSISVVCAYSDESDQKKAELYAKVGGENFGTRKSLKNEMSTYTFTDSISASGEIELIWDSQEAGISYFIKSVEVIYQD